MPMVDKAHILASLKKHWQEESSSAVSDIESLTFPVAKVKLASLISYVREQTIVYRRSQTGEEFLGLGKLYTHQDPTSRPQTLKILGANPKLKLFFAARFDPNGIKSPEWAHFGAELGVIPIIQWHTHADRSELQINYQKKQIQNTSEQAKLLFKVEELLDFMSERTQTSSFRSSSDIPSEEVWCKNIDEIAHKLTHQQFVGEIDKVVMARKRVLRAKQLVDPQTIFTQMQESYPEGHIFFLKTDEHRAFLSFTPERLFLHRAQDLQVDVIAGTRPRSEDPDEDLALAEDLMNSPKELEEHRIVATEIERKLKGFCTNVVATHKEELLKLKHVQHIKGVYEASPRPSLSAFDIMEHLHPTPAVGGRPWPEALSVIGQYERFDRGLYAGPCGLISESYSDLMVGIRSLVVYQDEVHIYGGAGIVAGSKGKSEWIETHNKMKNFKLSLS